MKAAAPIVLAGVLPFEDDGRKHSSSLDFKGAHGNVSLENVD
jgi:hypothetical protein